MESVIAALKDTPIPTILVVAGIVFLLLAIAGQLVGRIAVAPERQRWAALIGGGLLAIGLALHIVPQLRGISPVTEKVSPSQPSGPTAKEPTQQLPDDKLPTPQSPSPMPQSSAQASTEEKEPNNTLESATLITEGATVRGSIATKEDRDYFTFNASSTKTRVILRKQFHAAVDVYNHVEQRLEHTNALYDQSITLSFKSTPGSIYYIVVKSAASGGLPVSGPVSGDYELIVRKE